MRRLPYRLNMDNVIHRYQLIRLFVYAALREESGDSSEASMAGRYELRAIFERKNRRCF